MQHLLQTYAQYPHTIVRGQGSFVWDDKGKKYLDCYGGHAVCIIGHCHPSVAAAISAQNKKLVFYSNIFPTEPAQELAKLLASTLAPHSYKIFFANSGSEANETALKIARKFTGKQHVIAFKNAFHGRGIYPLAVTGIEHYHQFVPNVDRYTTFADMGSMKSVKAAFTNHTAAVICEPIQSIGGVRGADTAFYKSLVAFCKEKKILLIFDEIQTGLGRTGSFWFLKKIGVMPDIITTAKGIASGLPLSAVLIQKRIASTIGVGEHATTFGGGPLVTAAGVATLKVILSTGFLASVRKKAVYLRAQLSKLPNVVEVRGEGFLIGIKVAPKSSESLVTRCLHAGIIIGSSNEKHVFRLMPPLTMSRVEIDWLIRQLIKILI